MKFILSVNMPCNKPGFLTEPARPLEIGPAEYFSSGENQLVVKNKAIVINRIDSKVQKLGKTILPLMKVPHICSSDVAGEVWDIRPKVIGLKIGDRVCGLPIGVPQYIRKRRV